MNKITKRRLINNDFSITMSAVFQDLSPHQLPYFSITGSTSDGSCGCIHDEIAQYFPEYAELIKFHLFDVNGLPLHYMANSEYFFKKSKFDAFKSLVMFDENVDVMPNELDLIVWLSGRQQQIKKNFEDTMTKFGFDLSKFRKTVILTVPSTIY